MLCPEVAGILSNEVITGGTEDCQSPRAILRTDVSWATIDRIHDNSSIHNTVHLTTGCKVDHVAAWLSMATMRGLLPTAPIITTQGLLTEVMIYGGHTQWGPGVVAVMGGLHRP